MTARRAKVHDPVFARFYQRFAAPAMEKGEAEFRRELLGDVAGRVIEVGAGHGLNFAFYPPTVSEVTAVEPEPILRQGAEKAASGAAVPVGVVEVVADELPVDDESFDVGVASLVLRSVPDQEAALQDVYRVVRPGGELRFYEPVLAEHPQLARVQRLADPFWTSSPGAAI